MKILFTRFPLESAYGGAEIQTLSLMKGFMARGHAVAFLGSCPVILELCKAAGIPATKLEIGAPPVSKLGCISFTWRRGRMRTLLEAALAEFRDLDAVCMLSMSEKLLGTPVLKARNVPVYWIEHDRIGLWLRANPWRKMLLRQSRSAKTVAVSKLTYQHYVRLGWEPRTVVDIVNGVDAERLGQIKKDVKADDSGLVIGCVARLTADKGVILLLEALRALPAVQLKIVGCGKQEKRVRAMMKVLNAEGERVTLVPSVTSVGDFYRTVDALVLPSPLEDPCPLAPMEALMVGTPVILTDACGTAGYLQNGVDALIVRAGSVSDLSRAIAAVANPTTREMMAARGHYTAVTHFSLDRMIDRYEQLLSAVPWPCEESS